MFCTCLIVDFGVDHLVEIAQETEFPWLISNVRDVHSGRLLAEGRESLIFNWEGRKVGIIHAPHFPLHVPHQHLHTS